MHTAMSAFKVDTVDLNSGLHAYAQSTLPTEPSLILGLQYDVYVYKQFA